MKDPPRLLDVTLDPFEQHLLGSARQDRGSKHAQARCLVAIGTGTLVTTQAVSSAAATATTLGGATATTALLTKGLVAGIALGISLQGVAFVAEKAIGSVPRTPSAATSASPHFKPFAHATPTPSVPTLPFEASSFSGKDREIGAIPDHENTKSDPSSKHPSPSFSMKRPATAPHEAPLALDAPSKDELRREVMLLDDARRHCVIGNYAEALRLVERHRREFTRGTLAPEAFFIEVRALLGQGRRAEAVARSRNYLESSPNSSIAPRLNALLYPEK